MFGQKRTQLVIFGAGGHAKVVLDAAMRSGLFTEYCFVDPNVDPSQFWSKCPVYEKASLVQDATHFVVAIGDNEIRSRNFESALRIGLSPAVIKHPSAIVADDVRIGRGTVVLAGAIINPATSVGSNCIINSGAIVEHDNKIADHVHVAPGSRLGGGVTVHNQVLVGIGSTIVPGVTIGEQAKVAAGAVVTENVEAGSTVYGVPAKAKVLR
jgi:sugar O-acyltransferase (sialic acid O-acetyltransferase NeuD family)